LAATKSKITLQSGVETRLFVSDFYGFSVVPFHHAPPGAPVADIAQGLAQARLGEPAYPVPAPQIRCAPRAIAWGDGRTLEVCAERVATIFRRLADRGLSASDLWRLRRNGERRHADIPLANLDLLRLRSTGISASEFIVNGNYFLFHPEELDTPFDAYGDPVGLVLSGGVVHFPAQVNHACLFSGAEGVIIHQLRFSDGSVLLPGGARVPTHPRGLFDPTFVGGPVAIARYHGAPEGRTPADPDVAEYIVVGRHVVAFALGGNMPVPRSGCILRFPSPPPMALHEALIAGQPVTHDYAVTATDAIQAGPRIVADGVVTLDGQTLEDQEVFIPSAPGNLAQPSPFRWAADFDTTRAARVGVGIRRDGTRFLCALEGQSSYLDGNGPTKGATLRDLAHALISLGAREGLHLDGGGSAQVFRRLGGAVLRPGDVNEAFSDQIAAYDRPLPLGLVLALEP
jgi:hypothetical protein